MAFAFWEPITIISLKYISLYRYNIYIIKIYTTILTMSLIGLMIPHSFSPIGRIIVLRGLIQLSSFLLSFHLRQSKNKHCASSNPELIMRNAILFSLFLKIVIVLILCLVFIELNGNNIRMQCVI